LKKFLVIGIILLFIGIGVQPAFAVNTKIFSMNAGEWAWWEFNEGSGNIAYDSAYGHHGTVYGATWTADGLSFDGIDDYVDFDNHSVALGINRTDDFTILVRFRSTGSGMFYSMSHNDPARVYFNLILDDEGRITVKIGEDGPYLFNLSTTGSYNDGVWHIFECEYYGDTSNPTVNLYVDGNLDGTKTDLVYPMLDEDFQTAKVGRDSNAETDYLDGEIDDIKIYKNGWWHPGPPGKPTIVGPSNGEAGQTLIYTFNAIDPQGDDVRFHINWGDGTTGITTYVAPGSDKTVSHKWDTVDEYTIEAYAEDDWGNCGPSETFKVIIPRDKPFNFNHILQVLQLFSISTEEVKHKTTVRIHNSRGIIPYTLKLTEKSLYELGMFPRMTLKEAKQLVKGNSEKSQSCTLGTRGENFNCQISGSTYRCYIYGVGRLFQGYILLTLILAFQRMVNRDYNFPRFSGRIGLMSFGTYDVDYDIYHPSGGWVHTNGTNGVIKWETGGFYGNIDYWEEVYEYPHDITFTMGYYKGVDEFNGLWTQKSGWNPGNFIGNAKHVSLTSTPSWP
jgi:hypothetical protein